MDNFSFQILAQQGSARTGLFHTPHGDIKTPIFAPVGTQATVKAVTPAQLHEIEANLVLANTYHLYLRPGDALVAEMGGLHTFMDWDHPLLTDSGGFQVFSLAAMRKVDEEGVTFKSQIDGSMHRFTPEKSIAIQENLGADIIMAFDECVPPYDRKYNEEALARTHAWAERCLEAKKRPDQALFGIVQGGVFTDLRQESARWMAEKDFPGLAIGGLSVGEKKEEMWAMVEVVNKILPQHKPRYLMGVGSPEDLVNGVLRGIDIFDCVLPTRLARHHAAITLTGRVNLNAAIHTHDPHPIDPTCDCYTCQHFSRAYLRHLIMSKEMLAGTLISIHNIRTLLRLVRGMQDAISAGKMDQFAEHFFANYPADQSFLSGVDQED